MARRARNEGTIYKHKASGRWAAQLRLANGKRLSKYFDTQGEARTGLDQMKRDQAEAEQAAPGEDVPLSAFMERWLTLTQADHAPATSASYRALAHAYVLPAFGPTPLGDIRAEAARQWHADMLTRGLAPRTVQRAHTVLRLALEDAVEWGYLTKNPVRRTKAPRAPKDRRPRIWTPEQVGILLRATQGTNYEGLYATAAYAGLRRGELAGLRWKHVDLRRRKLTVVLSRNYIWGLGIDEDAPKSEASMATLPLLPELAALLETHRKRLLELGLSAEGDAPVFPSQSGKALHPTGLDKHFRHWRRRLDLPDIPLHGLRHTFASLLIDRGASPKEVQTLMRHASAATTFTFYGHLFEGRDRKALDRLRSAWPYNGRNGTKKATKQTGS